MGGFTDFEPDELWALANLCKRLHSDHVRKFADDWDEALLMKLALNKLADLLAELGYEPR